MVIITTKDRDIMAWGETKKEAVKMYNTDVIPTEEYREKEENIIHLSNSWQYASGECIFWIEIPNKFKEEIEKIYNGDITTFPSELEEVLI